MNPFLANNPCAEGGPPLSDPMQLVVFALDELRYALPLAVVERALRMVEITRLPKAPEMVHGVIDLHGEIVPVLDVRKRFQLPEKEPGLSDHLIVARTAKRRVVLVADAVAEVIALPAEARIEPGTILPGMEYCSGVVRLDGGMIFIHDLDVFLSLKEEQALDAAIEENC